MIAFGERRITCGRCGVHAIVDDAHRNNWHLPNAPDEPPLCEGCRGIERRATENYQLVAEVA